MIYLRAGVFHFERSLLIADRSASLVIRSCPGQAAVIEGPADAPAIVIRNSTGVRLADLIFVGSAAVEILLDGARDSMVAGNTFRHVGSAIVLDHSDHNQILRNVISDAAATGIELKDGSDANLIADNSVDGANARETFGGGIFLHGVRDNRVAHNFVRTTAGFGIGVSNWDDATINVGNIVEYNLLRQTVLDSDDSGAIYVLGRSAIDTQVVIAGNVIDGFGSAGNHNVGIYLDDSTSGATVVGNLIRDVGSDAVQIHGGQDNLIDNNLFDLGSTGSSPAVLFQAAPADTHPPNRQTGNQVTRNVILSSSPAPRLFISYDGGTPLVSGNGYGLAAGASPMADPAVVEQEPRLLGPDVPSPASLDDYASIQAAAGRVMGFKAIDIGAAGVRPPPP